jgi:hypothetical protein
VTLIGMANWADGGFPQITMGHKFAAALLVTNVHDDVLKQVRAPWPGFFIEVPDGLLELFDNDTGLYRPIRRVLVTRLQHPTKGSTWGYVAFTDTAVSIWRYGVTIEELLPAHLEGNPFDGDPTLLDITEQDERVMSLVGRLIVNGCLAMSDPTAVKEIGPGHAAYARSQRRRTSPDPVVRTFQIGRPLKHDFRERLRAYVRTGTGRLLNVQTLVCGHWKGQWHGPGNGLYKVIWRAPYWRGPEDAPIVVRAHELNGEAPR